MNVTMLTDRLRLRGLWLLALVIVGALIFSACDLIGDDSEQEQQEQQAQQQEVEQETAAAARAPRPPAREPAEEPGREPPPQAQGGGEGAYAYSIVFPSLALVMVGDATATGLVISDGYVLVDERSLRGSRVASVMLSNGDVLEDVPIVGRDQFTGLAYLGPLDSNLVRRLPGALLGDGEGISPGSSVFTVGYGADNRTGSLPSIYSGVLSGVDEWEPGQRTFLRTDARPDSPFSTVGMILIDSAGTVIGFAPAALVGLGWYVSTGDLARSLPPAEIAASRAPDPDSAATEHVVTVPFGHHSAQLVLGDDATGQSASLSISTETPAVFQLIDASGVVLQESRIISGATIISLAPETVGPYTLSIVPQPATVDGPSDDEASEAMPGDPTYRITSSAALMTMTETDEVASIEINTPFVGSIDIPGDADTFNLAVRGGAVYEILAQSLLIDAVLLIEGGGLDAVDDDTGGGPFGRDSALTLAPDEDGIVSLTIKDYADDATGAYILTIRQIGGELPEEEAAMEEEETTVLSATLPTPRGDVSVRGEITADGLQPTLLGIGSELGDDGSLIVQDNDGIFEIVVSIVGPDQSTARIFVFDADGQTVVSGRVVANCGAAGPCLASAVFITPEDAPGPAGEWRVLMQPEGAGSGISEWQIEVHRYDE
ncbi:MAG: hypothetical protein F4Z38_12250 [Chloroflexi bacterium]|nr:hypothetical protein [Chloroflexota bacterium]